LKKLDLRTGLFRYRCSYMIYSSALDALPVASRDAVYTRLQQTLSGRGDRDVMETLDNTRKGWR